MNHGCHDFTGSQPDQYTVRISAYNTVLERDVTGAFVSDSPALKSIDPASFPTTNLTALNFTESFRIAAIYTDDIEPRPRKAPQSPSRRLQRLQMPRGRWPSRWPSSQLWFLWQPKQRTLSSSQCAGGAPRRARRAPNDIPQVRTPNILGRLRHSPHLFVTYPLGTIFDGTQPNLMILKFIRIDP